ncbi:MAG TPA: hypothetical protein VEY91_12595 [Candidatus Limnocylindria bacterium]|nr:hypothetical protein [Candidatus Limnocylindria bacterium]
MNELEPDVRGRGRTPICARARAWCGGLMLAASLAAGAALAGPPAGTAIDNAAQASATDSATGGGIGNGSNPVRAIVQPLEALLLTADRADTLGPGETARFLHRLFNDGNAAAAVRLELTNLAGDDFDLASPTLVRDVNGDGLVDAGDVAVPSGGSITVAAGDSVDLIVTALAPAIAPPATAIALLRLTATSIAQGVVVSNTDIVTMVSSPPSNVTLFVDKSAGRSVVEIGDELEYTVQVANRSDTGIPEVTLVDALPLGFAYVTTTARRDGQRIPDPAGGSGPRLAFALGALGPNASATVRYRIRVGPAALDGDGLNRAWAEADPFISNVASARVALSAGVFVDEGTIVGTVFLDRDGDRRHGASDPGVPGVRLYLDDGTFAVTDAEGQYSFYGLSPRTHALKPDDLTLPPGARLAAVGHRQGEGASVRFVDLQRGDLQRADFALVAIQGHPSESPRDSAAADSALIAITAQRSAALHTVPDELSRGVRRELTPAGRTLVEGELKSRPAAGLLEERHGALDGSGVERPALASREFMVVGEDERDERVPEAETHAAPAGGAAAGGGADDPFEPALRDLDASLGFVGLADGDTARGRQIVVRVKGPLGFPLELRVDGAQVPSRRIGRRVTVFHPGLEVLEYVGVELRPGVNRLELIQRHPTGAERERVTLRLIAPDRLARLVLIAPETAHADGHHEALVRVRALDQRGVPVPERVFLTLESTLGRWAAPDLDPASPGHQVAVEGGEAQVPLVAPIQPGIARIVASAAGGGAAAPRAELSLVFLPELRPLFMVGTVEGTIALRDLARGAAVARPVTGFEQPLGSFASRFEGGGEAGARAALFMKGRVGEDVLLTLGLDSDRPRGSRRFRDIQPDAYYPVYGDGAVRGYDAQSTGRLYARLDRQGASLLYGDFITANAGGARSLSSYSRSLTGVQQRFENRRWTLESFGSRERGRRRVDELPGRGVSGPYLLPVAPLVENSEQIEILTRDRNQPSVVLGARPLVRFSDYTLETLTGRLLFKAPVASFDADLNPVSIRVSYDVEHGGPAYWIAGAEARVKPTERIELGGSYVADRDPTNPYALRSAFAAAKLGSTTVEGEYAVSVRGSSRSGPFGGRAGDGGRLELRHEGERVQARAFGAVTDAAFENPSGGIAAGRSEAGGRLSARLAARSRVLAEGLFTSEVGGTDRRGGLLLALDQGFAASMQGELGVRFAGGDPRPGLGDPISVALRAKLSAQVPSRPELSGYAELEQDLRESSRRLVALGGEYRFNARGRLYTRHELLSSLSSVYALHSGQRRLATVLGIDSDLARDAHLFSEYRLADALAGRDAEAAVGLRNGWRLEGWRVNTSFERVSPISGAGSGPTTALTGALETASESDVKASARMEVRTSRANDSFLTTLGLASRLSRAWTLLGRGIATVSDERARGVQARVRLQVGMAYRRPDVERWDALGRYELHVDREANLPESRRRRFAHVLSIHGTGRTFESFTTTASWAGKVVREDTGGWLTISGANRLHVRLARDLGRHWDAGVHGSALWGEGFRSRRDGLGVELGRSLQRDVWLSAGWNRFGYHDRDLPDEEWTEAGFYLRLRAKFDESLLRGLGVTP